MADTQYEHAGNADQLRSLQLGEAGARCNLCHFAQGKNVQGIPIRLKPVTLPGEKVVLFCQFCIKLCDDTGDTGYQSAASIMRSLPAENQAANDVILNKIKEKQNE